MANPRSPHSIPIYYCPSCNCASCIQESLILAAEAKRLASIEKAWADKIEAHRQLKISKDNLAKMQAAMVYMLYLVYVELGWKQTAAMARLAEEMVLRSSQVNFIRKRTELKLQRIENMSYPGEEWWERLVAAGAVSPNTWASVDLPEYCDKCQHLMPSAKSGFGSFGPKCTFCRTKSTKLNSKDTTIK